MSQEERNTSDIQAMKFDIAEIRRKIDQLAESLRGLESKVIRLEGVCKNQR